MTSPFRSVLCVLLLAGCGDDGTPATQRCASFVGPALLDVRAPGHLAMVGVSPRYDTGLVRALSLSDLSVRPVPIEATGDTVLRPLGPAIALLHRAIGNQDNLTLFDPRTGAVCQVPLLTDAEARAARSLPFVNAHDVVAVDAGRLYVARHSMASLAVVDVAAGAVVRTIDLSRYQGAAALPHADALAVVNGEVWVTLERDDDPVRQHPMQPGLIARVDPRTDAVTGTVTLLHANPYGSMLPSPDGRQRWVATLGSYNVVGDGGVEAVDVATGQVTMLVREEERGVEGNIDAFAVVDANRLVLRVTAERVGTAAIDDLRVVLLDLRTRAVTTLLRMSQWGAAAPVVVGGRVFVADPGAGAYHTGAGMHVFSPDGTRLRVGAIAMDPGLMPYDAQPMW